MEVINKIGKQKITNKYNFIVRLISNKFNIIKIIVNHMRLKMTVE